MFSAICLHHMGNVLCCCFRTVCTTFYNPISSHGKCSLILFAPNKYLTERERERETAAHGMQAALCDSAAIPGRCSLLLRSHHGHASRMASSLFSTVVFQTCPMFPAILFPDILLRSTRLSVTALHGMNAALCYWFAPAKEICSLLLLSPTWPMFSATLSPKMGTLLCECSARQEHGSLPMWRITCAMFSASVFPIMCIRLGCPAHCSLLLCSKHVQCSLLSLVPIYSSDMLLSRAAHCSLLWRSPRWPLFSAAASPKIGSP